MTLIWSAHFSSPRIPFRHTFTMKKLLTWVKEHHRLTQNEADPRKQEITKRRMTYLYGENPTDDD